MRMRSLFIYTNLVTYYVHATSIETKTVFVPRICTLKFLQFSNHSFKKGALVSERVLIILFNLIFPGSALYDRSIVVS